MDLPLAYSTISLGDVRPRGREREIEIFTIER